MKRSILLFVFTALVMISNAQDAERDAIKNVIQQAYVEGIHNRAGIHLVEAGFHPGFEMLSMTNGLLTRFPIYSWITNLKKVMSENKPHTVKTTAEIPMVDIAGDAAVARVELFRDGVHTFTDYMCLYKFEDGWKIVVKTYYRIPQPSSLH
jgi:hypothetical protein